LAVQRAELQRSTVAHPSAQPEVRLVNRVLPPAATESASGDIKLFAPEGSAEGCAAGECLPGEEPQKTGVLSPEPPPIELAEADEPPPDIVEPPRAAPRPSGSSDDDRWRRAVDGVREASPRHGKSLSYARFLGFISEGVKVAFPPDAAFHRAQVTGMSRSLVETELAKSLGRPIKLIEDTSAAALSAAPKSIAEVEATDRSSREKIIADKVKSHPALRNVLRHLGGALEHIAYLEPAPRPIVAGPSAAADEGDGGPAVD
jgi:hypothetical protein